MSSSIREKIDPAILEGLDSTAQIVARLYEEGKKEELLGNEPNELRDAVYNLGKAYMYLYNILLEEHEEALEDNDELADSSTD